MDKVEHNEKLQAQLQKVKNIKVHDIVEETKKEVDHFKKVIEETIEKMELHDKLNEAKEKVNELNDKFLRLYSEFDNYRKRTQKEKADLHKSAGEDVIKSLLPVLDDFERAMKAMDENDDPQHVKEGVKLIYNKLLNTLKQKGLEPMEDATGKEFNVEEHEAITRIPAPSEDMKGKVIDQVERGYKLNGKVIRYAKVVVGQ
ncbi:MAG TPA: nucleotide exchange factor GrpE [Flavobacteriales bacterium]|nr:nucleotide exchange factor GrpE [Flavobacteriales bacterium]